MPHKPDLCSLKETGVMKSLEQDLSRRLLVVSVNSKEKIDKIKKTDL